MLSSRDNAEQRIAEQTLAQWHALGIALPYMRALPYQPIL